MSNRYWCQFIDDEGFATILLLGFFPTLNESTFMFCGCHSLNLRSKKEWEQFLGRGTLQEENAPLKCFLFDDNRRKVAVDELFSEIEKRKGGPVWDGWPRGEVWIDDEGYFFKAALPGWCA